MGNTGHSVYVSYVLGQLMQRRELASLFLDPDNPDTFTTGYIEGLNPRQVLVRCLTPWGEPDGFMALRIENVVRVLSGEDFEKRLETMMAIRKHPPQPCPVRPGEADLFSGMLRFAMERGHVVTVWDSQNTTTGYVCALDDLRVTLSTMDFFGLNSGEAALQLRSLILVSMCSEEEEMYRQLNQYASKGGE